MQNRTPRTNRPPCAALAETCRWHYGGWLRYLQNSVGRRPEFRPVFRANCNETNRGNRCARWACVRQLVRLSQSGAGRLKGATMCGGGETVKRWALKNLRWQQKRLDARRLEVIGASGDTPMINARRGCKNPKSLALKRSISPPPTRSAGLRAVTRTYTAHPQPEIANSVTYGDREIAACADSKPMRHNDLWSNAGFKRKPCAPTTRPPVRACSGRTRLAC
jgi:hypothetical protein